MTSPGSTASIGKAPLADLKSGLATAPTLFAAEEFPQLTTLINRKFEWEGDIELAVDLVQRSQGKITAAPRIYSYVVNSND
jgi:geranylgeranyl pyrophosphate synthase